MTPQPDDLMAAYKYGVLVEYAYQMYASDPNNLTPAAPPVLLADYNVKVYLTAIDHVAEIKERKFFGFIAQSKSNPTEFVGAVRGTEGFIEWLIDAEFLPTQFTPVPAAGDVEDGFFSIYDSMTGIVAGETIEQNVNQLLTGLAPGSLTIAGHSLGGAIASMWALDVAVNHPVKQLAIYTLASPRVGFSGFVDCFNSNVFNSIRIFNEPDLVPKLPPLYDDKINTGQEIDSKLVNGIKHSIPCYHELVTYLRVLNADSPFSLGSCASTPPSV